MFSLEIRVIIPMPLANLWRIENCFNIVYPRKQKTAYNFRGSANIFVSIWGSAEVFVGQKDYA